MSHFCAGGLTAEAILRESATVRCSPRLRIVGTDEASSRAVHGIRLGVTICRQKATVPEHVPLLGLWMRARGSLNVR